MTEQLVPSPSIWPTDRPVKLRKLKWGGEGGGGRGGRESGREGEGGGGRGREGEGGGGREREAEEQKGGESYSFILNCLSQSPLTSLSLSPKTRDKK